MIDAINAAAIDAKVPAINGTGIKSARVDAAIVVRRAYGSEGAVWVYELPIHESRIVPADFFGNDPTTRPDLYAQPTKVQLENGDTYNAKDASGKVVARVKQDKHGNPVALKMSLNKYFTDFVAEQLKQAIYEQLHATDPARWSNPDFVSRRWTVKLEYDVFIA